ncbi:MAG: glycosyltransferase [bacterium]|nr:glycosyltransferase [bacterium]
MVGNISFDIILPTYNGAQYVRQSIESVLAQTYRNFHLTVIDDGSRDETVEMVREIVERHPEEITFLATTLNLRAAGARMEAIRKVHGDIIAFIDQDDIWQPEKLACQAVLFNKGADVVHTNVAFIDEDGALMPHAASNENKRREELFRGTGNSLDMQISFCMANPIRLTTSALTRQAFEDVGGFDTSLFGGEDWSFWLALAMDGKQFSLDSRTLVFRRIHRQNTSRVHKIERSKGVLRACRKARALYPVLLPFLGQREYAIVKRSLTLLIRSCRVREARRYFQETKSYVPARYIPQLFFLSHSSYFGCVLLRIRRVIGRIGR